MNASDRLAAGVVLLGGAPLVDLSGILPGAAWPLFWAGLAFGVSGLWRLAVHLAEQAPDGGDRR